MDSIRNRFIILTIVAVVISVVAVGLTGIYAVRRLGNESSAEILSSRCENVQRALEADLQSIEMAVTTVSGYASEDLEGLSEEQLHEHLAHVNTVFNAVADSTNAVLTYYYRISPEVSAKETGFWYSQSGQDGFIPLEPTDIAAYDPEDISHIGWFTIPKEKGHPTWLDLYFNGNLQTLMISYAAPIYYQESFVGVIGIDMAYATLSEQLEDIRIYQTGYAFLTDENGHMWHFRRNWKAQAGQAVPTGSTVITTGRKSFSPQGPFPTGCACM